MKSSLLALPLGILMLSSCTTIYKCGETRPEKFSVNKKTMALVNERDSLCSDTKELTDTLMALRADYASLQSQSAMTEEEMLAALGKKSSELANQSELLSEREKRLQELQEIIARQDSITNRLNSILRDALLSFKSDELSVEVKNGKVYVSMSDKLLFKSGSASVEDKGKVAIDTLASVLQNNKEIDILIEGHTDNVPIKTSQYQDNWALSVARATTIVRLLADQHDIDPKRLTAAGRGEYQPRASNDTPEGRAQNRRTDIILSPKLDELMNLLGQN